MKLRAIYTSGLLIIPLVLFLRFGIGAYAALFVFRFADSGSIWAVGGALFVSVKLAQLSPYLYDIGLINEINRDLLVFLALFATPIDAIVTLKALPWVVEELEPANVLLSIGCIGWSRLVQLSISGWVVLRSPDRPQPQPARSMPTAEPPIDRSDKQSLLSILTKTPVSTILVGEPGTGKTMTASTMARQWVRDGHHVYYIDSKMDAKELSLWADACSDRYQFDGTLIRDPNQWCQRLMEAFDDFEEFRLRHLNDGKQTICILDELPAVMSAFKAYKADSGAALNFINRIVNTLPSRNCHILALAQNPSCTDTLPTGTIGTLKKIILAKSGSESQLAEWSNLTMMRSVRLDTLSSAIRKSSVDRGCYYSVVGEWLPMESWIRSGDYNRDTLGGGDNRSARDDAAAHGGYVSVTAATATTAAADLNSIDAAILEYFSAVFDRTPKTIKNMRDSSRLRDRATVLEFGEALDRLTASGKLDRCTSGWSLASWSSQ